MAQSSLQPDTRPGKNHLPIHRDTRAHVPRPRASICPPTCPAHELLSARPRAPPTSIYQSAHVPRPRASIWPPTCPAHHTPRESISPPTSIWPPIAPPRASIWPPTCPPTSIYMAAHLPRPRASIYLPAHEHLYGRPLAPPLPPPTTRPRESISTSIYMAPTCPAHEHLYAAHLPRPPHAHEHPSVRSRVMPTSFYLPAHVLRPRPGTRTPIGLPRGRALLVTEGYAGMTPGWTVIPSGKEFKMARLQLGDFKMGDFKTGDKTGDFRQGTSDQRMRLQMGTSRWGTSERGL
nr:leucine-rich repeat extensin-like protein 3 [Penaeus vannamei]